MELTPDLLLEAKFDAARRGYDMAEVDDFLERVAEAVEILLQRLAAEFDRAEAAQATIEELRLRVAALEEVRPEQVLAPAEPAEPAVAEAPAPEPAPVSTAINVDEPMRILIHAERTAEATIAEARTEAERLRREAADASLAMRSEAESMLTEAKTNAEAEARKAGEAARRAVLDEVQALRSDRDALAEDVRALKRWLDEQRARMRSTARELQRLVDDPNALRESAVPELAAVELPAGVSDDTAGDAADALVVEVVTHADDDARAAQPPGGVHAAEPDATAGEPTAAVAMIFDDDGDPVTDRSDASALRVFDQAEPSESDEITDVRDAQRDLDAALALDGADRVRPLR